MLNKDYYPACPENLGFGMLACPVHTGLPNRHEAGNESRYGFQGQEKDDEIKGEGNSINYKYRMHSLFREYGNARVGRFFAVDPLTFSYPHYTPYSFSGNKLIAYRELEGLEEYYSADGTQLGKVGSSTEKRVVNEDIHWRIFSDVRDNFSNGLESMSYAGVTVKVDGDLYNKAENNLLQNSAPLFVGSSGFDELITIWGNENLPKSQKYEWGSKIFSQTFTSWDGSTFIGYLPGTAVSQKQTKDVSVTFSFLMINGVLLGGQSHDLILNPNGAKERKTNYNSNFTVRDLIHTHPIGNATSRKLSEGDILEGDRRQMNIWMFAYMSNQIYWFDYLQYNNQDSNFNTNIKNSTEKKYYLN